MKKFHRGKYKIILNFLIISLLLFSFVLLELIRVQQLICCGGTIDKKKSRYGGYSHFPLIKKKNNNNFWLQPNIFTTFYPPIIQVECYRNLRPLTYLIKSLQRLQQRRSFIEL